MYGGQLGSVVAHRLVAGTPLEVAARQAALGGRVFEYKSCGCGLLKLVHTQSGSLGTWH